MDINKEKGKWWNEYSHREYNWDKPELKDDIAYFLYCQNIEDFECIPQITFMYNYTINNKQIIKYYIEADRLLKLKKICSKLGIR